MNDGFDLVSDIVRAEDGHGGIDFDVHIDEIIVAHFADEAFFNEGDFGDGGGDGGDALGESGVGGAIHEFIHGRAEEAPAVPGDDAGGEEGGAVIGGFVAGAAPERDGDADKGKSGGDGITAMVPGIRGERGAFEGEPLAPDKTKENFLGDHDADEDEEGKGGWSLMGPEDITNGGGGDPEGGENEDGGNDGGSEGLGFAMAVRVTFIGREFSEGDTAPDDEGTDEVSKGFDAIGDQGLGMAEEAGGDFDGGKERIQNQAKQSDLHFAVEFWLWHNAGSCVSGRPGSLLRLPEAQTQPGEVGGALRVIWHMASN